MSSPAEITGSSVPRLPRGVRVRFDESREEWMLLGPERVLKLDQIALEILKRCDGEADLAAILDSLASAFETEVAVIEKDVEAFLTDLRARGMLDIS